MSELVWSALSAEDLPRLIALARACLEADGGLPDLVDEEYLRAHYAHATSIGASDLTGELVAVAAIGVSSEGLRIGTGMVHPTARGQGLGDELFNWAQNEAAGRSLSFGVDNATEVSDELFARRGYDRTFAETVMRHPLGFIPRRARPRGLVRLSFSEYSAPLFHQAWRESFADRPGFTDLDLTTWAGTLRSDAGFRPRDSSVLLRRSGRPVAFITLSGAWIEQTGVVPEYRGRGIAGHLVARSLTRLRRSGERSAWLTVSVGNPARALYERLGFQEHGTRAVYATAEDATRG
ncbi:GNAT family N-acetyltransferase [Kribbia dieselivorans]|uniref:GNAT family N-acetyltransferase n=1 Tax=Kribbia dieselivorans TaxID=331526 RepID=UPI000838AFE9|nr:GNAT family N-acetyltransferase [Kribbia dieselivorans]